MNDGIQNDEEELTDVMQLRAAPVGACSEGKEKASISILGQEQYGSHSDMKPEQLCYTTEQFVF